MGLLVRTARGGEHSFQLKRHTLKFDEEAGTLNGLSWKETSCEKIERDPEKQINFNIHKCIGYRYVFYLNTDSLRYSIYNHNLYLIFIERDQEKHRID